MEYGDKHILVLGAGASGHRRILVLAPVGAHVVLNDYKACYHCPQMRKKDYVSAG